VLLKFRLTGFPAWKNVQERSFEAENEDPENKGRDVCGRVREMIFLGLSTKT